jgi:hypothetical protein
MVDLTQIVSCIITLITTVISVFVIPILKNKLNEQRLNRLNTVIDIAVYAAEQIFTPEQWSEKKQWVQNWLNGRGYDADVDEIDALIEAAVKRLRIEMKDRNEKDA